MFLFGNLIGWGYGHASISNTQGGRCTGSQVWPVHPECFTCSRYISPCKPCSSTQGTPEGETESEQKSPGHHSVANRWQIQSWGWSITSQSPTLYQGSFQVRDVLVKPQHSAFPSPGVSCWAWFQYPPEEGHFGEVLKCWEALEIELCHGQHKP